MSIAELQERQSWTLHQKIDHTVGAIEAFVTAMKKKGNGVYVSFSGGKDSTVLLDICRRYVDKDMLGVFCNTGNEYPSIVQFVRQTDNIEIIRPKLTVSQVLATYGFPLVSKEQSQGIRQVRHGKSEKLRNIRLYGTNPEDGNITGKISEKWKFLIDAPFDISEKCCDCLKKRPFSAYEKKQTGALYWVLWQLKVVYVFSLMYVEAVAIVLKRVRSPVILCLFGRIPMYGHISDGLIFLMQTFTIWVQTVRAVLFAGLGAIKKLSVGSGFRLSYTPRCITCL